jgi:hypothetical protein
MISRITRGLVAGLVAAGSLVLALVAIPFATAPTASAAPHYVKGDFDGDGRVDLAVGAPGANRVRISYTHIHPGGSHTSYLHPGVPSIYPMQFGYALSAGDFNGDGRSDLAIGAPRYTTPAIGDGVVETRGAIFLYLGTSHGLAAQPLTLVGPYDGDEPYELAQALASADINGDGYTDLAATLPGIDDGNIRVWYGTPTGFSPAGFQPLNDYEATSLAFGDVNGDGHPELVAGSTVDLANPTDQWFGDVMIFPGSGWGLSPTPQKIRGDQVGVWSDLGTAVAAGDINGDGYSDVVVGAAYDRADGVHASGGSIVVLTGGPAGLSASRHQTINSHAVYSHDHDGDGFGSALAVAKLTSDGYADVVVGAPTAKVGSHAEAGAVYVLRGSALGVSLAHRQRITAGSPGVPGAVTSHANFGAEVFTAKLDTDSHTDLAIGVPNKTDGASHSGMVVRLHGKSSGISTSHAHSFGGSVANGRLGASIR